MNSCRNILFLLIAGLLLHTGYSQTPILDSLKGMLSREKEDTNKIIIAINICKELNNSALYKDAIQYGKQAVDLAEKLRGSSIKAEANFAKKSAAKASINLGNSYEDIADYPDALIYYNKGLKAKEELGDRMGMDHAYNNIGLVYENESDYPTALDYFFKSLNISTDIKDSASMDLTYNNIGVIYLSDQNYKQAITYFQKSMELCQHLGDKTGVANAYTNIGQVYQSENNFLDALDYYKKCLALREETKDLDGIAYSYNNIGKLYSDIITRPDSLKKKLIQLYYSHMVPPPTLGNIDLALMDSSLALHQKALEISKRIDDKFSIVYALEGIGDLTKQRGEYASALYYFRQGAALAKQINTRHEYYDQLNNISQCFEKMGKPDSAFFYFKLAMAVKDTIFNGDKQKEIGREEAKAEYEKKQAVAEAENKKQLEVAEEQNKRKQLVIYTGAAGFIMLGFFAFFIAQRLKITRRQKTIIENQKDSLDKAFLELEDAKQLVEEKHKDLTDSIHYASRIQNALLTTDNYLKQHLDEYFILFKPRDIVSGDFYWALEHKGTFYLACCDCTGHGVPGAFMSLLNLTFLHQTVIEKGISQPDKIFGNIRANVIEAFNQDGSTETKDGMDAVLCSINFQKNILSAACANNPLWIVRKGALIEFKADKIPIGEGDETKPFTLHETGLQKDDRVYMFTDGYADQFGGPNGKKYKQAQLKELLLSIHLKPMKDQHKLLDEAFKSWKGTLDQVDDVCVMGLRV
jgi:serine phosphatase RsbU (regulator of sigma subunit)